MDTYVSCHCILPAQFSDPSRASLSLIRWWLLSQVPFIINQIKTKQNLLSIPIPFQAPFVFFPSSPPCSSQRDLLPPYAQCHLFPSPLCWCFCRPAPPSIHARTHACTHARTRTHARDRTRATCAQRVLLRGPVVPLHYVIRGLLSRLIHCDLAALAEHFIPLTLPLS